MFAGCESDFDKCMKIHNQDSAYVVDLEKQIEREKKFISDSEFQAMEDVFKEIIEENRESVEKQARNVCNSQGLYEWIASCLADLG